MLTPKEIQSKEFGKSFRGFDETEVNDFLNEIIKDYTALLDGNETLRAELACAQKTVEEFRLIEQGMRETLTVAQKTADEITAKPPQRRRRSSPARQISARRHSLKKPPARCAALSASTSVWSRKNTHSCAA